MKRERKKIGISISPTDLGEKDTETSTKIEISYNREKSREGRLRLEVRRSCARVEVRRSCYTLSLELLVARDRFFFILLRPSSSKIGSSSSFCVSLWLFESEFRISILNLIIVDFESDFRTLVVVV